MIKLAPDDPRLSSFCVFSGLGAEEMEALLGLSDVVPCQAGQPVVKAGEEGHCLYVVLEGSVKVEVSLDGGQVELARIGAGEFFGEVSLVDDGPRSANVIALEDGLLMRITRTTIGVLGGLQPAAAIQILGAIGKALVARLRATNQKYLDILLRYGSH